MSSLEGEEEFEAKKVTGLFPPPLDAKIVLRVTNNELHQRTPIQMTVERDVTQAGGVKAPGH